MDKAEHDKLLAAIEEEHKRRQEREERRFVREVRSLARVYRIAQRVEGNNGSASTRAASAPKKDGSRRSPPALVPIRSTSTATPTALVRAAIRRIEGRFMNSNLRELISRDYGRQLTPKQISSVLHKLRANGEITVVQEGGVNTPAFYTSERQESA